MKSQRTSVIAALLLACGLSTSALAVIDVNKAADNFAQANPGTAFYREAGRITSIYGQTFATGQTPDASAEAFLANGLDVFGVPATQLVPGSIAADDAHLRPMMPNDDGSMRFTLVAYRQQLDNIPVMGADLLLLTRNAPGYPLVLARNNLRVLGDFTVDQAVAANPAINAAYAAASALPGMAAAVFTPAELVIWAGTYDQTQAPVLAVTFEATSGMAWMNSYQKHRIVADAATGAILNDENLINQIDVIGQIQGQATTGIKAAECNAEAIAAMPYVKVTVGANSAFADANGNFTVTNAGSADVSASAGVRGRYFRVFSPSTDAPPIAQNFTPGVSSAIVFNSANTDQTRRAEVNAYNQANVVRDMVITALPTYPTIANQFEGGSGGLFRVNVAVSGTCNAFYDGTSINFYSSGGGCSNTAYSDVVHHEYGHHVVSAGGSGQGQYGEGTGDCMGVILSDQPILGYGFQSNCNAGIRTAANSLQYPQDEGSVEIHTAGQLISACVWSTRNAMVASSVPNYQTLLKKLCVNAVVLHRGTAITPQITIDWLTIDDTDGNISNGTPNYTTINTGFSAHNMAAPAISLLAFTYPDGKPTSVLPGQPTSFRVDVNSISATAQPGTGLLTYKINAGAFTTVPMTQNTPNHYTATLPAILCGDTMSYYFRAQTTASSTVADPETAPASTFGTFAATSNVTAFNDNFQTNQGWVVTNGAGLTTGTWARAIPSGQSASGRTAPPTADFDASGQCFVTQNGDGDFDVDGGATTLTSPTMNASGGAATLTYARWYSNDTGGGPNADTFVVEISGNNGASWTNLETVGPAGAETHSGWFVKSFAIPGAQATNQFKVRFTASDTGTGSVVEAAVDAVKLTVASCVNPSCPADFDGDGSVDIFDYDAFVNCFEGISCPPGKTADFDGDGTVDFFDYDAFVVAFEAPCL